MVKDTAFLNYAFAQTRSQSASATLLHFYCFTFALPASERYSFPFLAAINIRTSR